ncbi:Hypothetical protein CINCED_3A007678 [Cinara cedri]|uniref:Uncharacterized protein n=1 Tax=Cinara cedri TaxID=506608 RepID=A0A5E4MQ29_9HEMI|nr:Hypothetical protein CINCED_3A007678 [Cinara cedri]
MAGKTVRVTAAMERLTVHRASYRPVPIPACCRWTPAAAKRSGAAFETDTVHGLAYRPRDPQDPIKSARPRDHGFLDGDGLSRFRCTLYRSDYTTKNGRPARPNLAVRYWCTRTPVQTDTTAGTAYRPPAPRPQLWRYTQSAYREPSRPMETSSVQQLSYRPAVPGACCRTIPAADRCGKRGAPVDESPAKTRAPVESITTYTSGFRAAPPAVPDQCARSRISEYRAPRAHNYSAGIKTTKRCK